jgi:hypothetical protein
VTRPRAEERGGETGGGSGAARARGARRALALGLGLGVAAASAASGGCADGGEPVVPAGDAGTMSGDAGIDAGVDGGADGAAGGCAAGEHPCARGCERDRANTPDVGCRLGCGSAPCPAPEGGAATCTTAGICDFECTPPRVREGARCACAPTTCEALGAMCGTPDDGCGGALACGSCGTGATCMAGACVCDRDRGEPNDSEARAVGLGATNDADDGPTIVTRDFGSHDALDVDFFFVDVTDGFDAGNPILTVTLDEIPAGWNLDLAVGYRCTSGGDAHSCRRGEPSSGVAGAGCASSNPGTSTEVVELATECGGSNESGRLILRVATTGSGPGCERYRLRVDTR